jgi:hypothetical protein
MNFEVSMAVRFNVSGQEKFYRGAPMMRGFEPASRLYKKQSSEVGRGVVK